MSVWQKGCNTHLLAHLIEWAAKREHLKDPGGVPSPFVVGGQPMKLSTLTATATLPATPGLPAGQPRTCSAPTFSVQRSVPCPQSCSWLTPLPTGSQPTRRPFFFPFQVELWSSFQPLGGTLVLVTKGCGRRGIFPWARPALRPTYLPSSSEKGPSYMKSYPFPPPVTSWKSYYNYL